MLEIHFTENKDVYAKARRFLSRLLPIPFQIAKTENGKPFIEGNPLFFSLSHSGDRAVIAISDKPVGVDLEQPANKNFGAVLSRFSDREKAEIAGTEDFLRHWVVREAYIKMLGSTIAEKLKGLEYVQGVLYDMQTPAECEISVGCKDGGIYCICSAK